VLDLRGVLHMVDDRTSTGLFLVGVVLVLA
jgi:hypothetical protein